MNLILKIDDAFALQKKRQYQRRSLMTKHILGLDITAFLTANRIARTNTPASLADHDEQAEHEPRATGSTTVELPAIEVEEEAWNS